MKKLLSVVAVAAIVTSAFAFTKGQALFCVRSGSACTVISGVHIETGTANFKQYPLATGQWNGQIATCTGLANCSQDIRLVDN
jgi:dissimilatory sulfite reductase (desulfoviridin) alpha/beta subunit